MLNFYAILSTKVFKLENVCKGQLQNPMLRAPNFSLRCEYFDMYRETQLEA